MKVIVNPGKPAVATYTLTMSQREAILIAALIGSTTGRAAYPIFRALESALPDGAVAAAYDALRSDGRTRCAFNSDLVAA